MEIMLPPEYFSSMQSVSMLNSQESNAFILNAKSPYVKLSMLKTINKPKVAAGGRHF